MFEARCSARGERLQVAGRANGLPHGRLGLAVSRKVARTAVARNYARRVVREHFRRNASALVGLDLVVSPRRVLQRGDYRMVGEEFLNLVGRLRCRVFS